MPENLSIHQYLVFERGGYFQNPDKMTEAVKEMLRPVALIPDAKKDSFPKSDSRKI
ncbi:MAG: hypothetical protein IPN18_17995 [Ignavibacteriales bacterium]|nr:hypothetical protein [Ignavibacteriales bacterium]